MNTLNKETMLKSAPFQNWNVMVKDDFSVGKVCARLTQLSIFCHSSIISATSLCGGVYQFSEAGKIDIRCFLLAHSHIFSILKVSLISLPVEIGGKRGLVLATGLKSSYELVLQVFALTLCKTLSRLM